MGFNFIFFSSLNLSEIKGRVLSNELYELR